MALSQDLRLRIVDLVVSGVSRRKAAVHFQVSASSAIRFVKQAEEVGHVDVKVRKKRKSRLDPFHGDLVDWIGEQPDLTLAELCSRVFDADGLRVGSSTLDDWLRANQITYKKTAHASEQERSDVRAKRYRWRKRQDWLKQHLHLLGRIVFIDETGLNTKMARPAEGLQRASVWWLPSLMVIGNHDVHCRSALRWYDGTVGVGWSHGWPSQCRYGL